MTSKVVTLGVRSFLTTCEPLIQQYNVTYGSSYSAEKEWRSGCMGYACRRVFTPMENVMDISIENKKNKIDKWYWPMHHQYYLNQNFWYVLFILATCNYHSYSITNHCSEINPVTEDKYMKFCWSHLDVHPHLSVIYIWYIMLHILCSQVCESLSSGITYILVLYLFEIVFWFIISIYIYIYIHKECYWINVLFVRDFPGYMRIIPWQASDQFHGNHILLFNFYRWNTLKRPHLLCLVPWLQTWSLCKLTPNYKAGII